jgi:hypothetical protein
MTSQTISSQYSTTGTSDSIASSYRPPEQKKQQNQLRPMFAPPTTNRTVSAKYPYESQQQSDVNVTDELIHHPTIIKLQQQNFHRLLSNAGSTTSSSSIAKQQISQIHSGTDDDQITYVSTTTTTNDRIQPIKPTSDTQRAVLHQRKQALMKAIQSINKQMEELDMQ